MGVFLFIFTTTIFLFPVSTLSSAPDSISLSESLSDVKRESLVSRDGSFELGFFSPGSSKSRYLGIWYHRIKVPTVVWVANRCNPINDSSGLLVLNRTGNLVLSNKNKGVVWSVMSLAKEANRVNPILQLLDSGNLVLRDEKDENPENYLWQSFDYPSNTHLPGMKFGKDFRRGLDRSLSAWKSSNDPCPSDFTSGVELDQKLHTSPQVKLKKGNNTIYHSGPWNGLRLSGAQEMTINPFYDFYFVHNEDEVYFMYNLKNKSLISISFLNHSTSTSQRILWLEAEKKWILHSYSPRDYCDFYGRCGANGICIATANPSCQCLKGFKPKSQEKWSLMDFSEGCVHRTPLSCKDKDRDGFIKHSGMKLPDSTHTWVNKSVNLKECKAKCLSNCSCMAVSNSDITGKGSGCIMWFGDLIDIRLLPITGQDLYIRMSAAEIEKSVVKVRAVVVAAVVGVLIVMLVVGYYIFRRVLKGEKKTKRQENGRREEDLELPLFKLSTIITATDNFSDSNKLGEGGFGPVYKGMLEDGQEIAVKRLSLSSGQGMNEFKNEVILIAKLQHRNLVKLLGFCIQEEEKLLVYEYMPNKSLDFFIFDQNHGKLLDWSKRFKIICGIARGLLYLHQDSRLRIIHRDLKASNVLLDKELNPKISDFGLARIFGGDQTEGKTNRVIGTYGYMAPEYAFDGLFSIKSDVFSFGILVLEIVSGKKSRGFHHENHGLTLIGHAWRLMREGKTFELIDLSLLRDSNNLQEVLRCIHVGLLCVQQWPGDRPDMSSIVLMLGSENVLPQPKAPGYFMQKSSSEGDLSSTNTITITALEAR
ncbi:hypothetical protein UlMin_003368 [Ulmus minor]